MTELSANKRTDQADPHCLKCGKIIAHNIPYKYEGKTFHARCLVCNFCERNLVGKPFLIEGLNLFCGEECKQSFLSGPPALKLRTQFSQTSEESDDVNIGSAHNESLIEALDKTEPPTLGSQYSRDIHNYEQDPDQITDYPRRSSFGSSQISLTGSIRSSLSAVSESSLASEYSYDANRKPKKKILKSPRRPYHRRARKNVRWNILPENESDTTSLDSFDSTSTSNSLFYQARKGMNEARQTWKEFERSPPHGSTGITPVKGNRFNTRPSSAPSMNASFSSPSSNFVPQLEPAQEHVQSSSSNNLLHPAHSSHRNLRLAHSLSPQDRFSRSPSPPSTVTHSLSHQSSSYISKVSPLTSTPTSVNVTHQNSTSGFEKARTMHSPMRRHFSDTAIFRSLSPQSGPLVSNPSDLCRKLSPDDIDSPLILKLSDSKVSELEESTLEDRQNMHIFQFPQTSKCNSEPSPPVHSMKNTSPRTSFLEDEDDGDYDHLSPLDNDEKSTVNHLKGNDLVAKMVASRNKQIDKTKRTMLISYTEEDIEDGLRAIDEEDSQLSSQNAFSTNQEPPPVPIKQKRSRLASAETEQKKIGLILKRTVSDPVSSNLTSRLSTINSSSPIRQPPPVPPKHSRKKQDEKKSATNSTTKKDTYSGDGGNEDNILPPPPQFAFHSSNREIPDDLLGSTSTSTLIAEQDIPSTDVTEKYSYGSGYLKSSPPIQEKQHWRDNNLKIDDRVVVGAEDPFPSSDNLPKHQQLSSMAPRPRFSQKSGNSLSHLGTKEQSSSSYLQPQRSPTYKVSMETAFNEGNLLKHSTFATQEQLSSEKSKQSTIAPHRPAPPPPVPKKILNENDSIRIQTSIKEQSKKSVDPSIEQLLSDLNIEDDSHQHSHSVCTVCSKSIQSSRDCISFNSHSYHSKCFFCHVCRSHLYDKVKKSYCGHLYCQQCYLNSFQSNLKHNVSREYHRPAAGGQITTV